MKINIIASLLVVFLLFFHCETNAQVIKVTTTEGSYNILREYFQHNIHYSAIAKENDVAGEVIVSFNINQDQKITNVKLVKALMPVCDTEVVQKVRDFQYFKKGIQLKPQQYTVAVNFISINQKGEKGTKDTLNKAGLKKIDTEGILVIKIIGKSTYRKPEVVY